MLSCVNNVKVLFSQLCLEKIVRHIHNSTSLTPMTPLGPSHLELVGLLTMLISDDKFLVLICRNLCAKDFVSTLFS